MIEVQRYLNDKKKLESFLIETYLKENIPIICTKKFSLVIQSDFYDSHDTLLCISQQKYIDSEDRMRSSKEFMIKSSKDMYSLLMIFQWYFVKIPPMLAQKCSFFPTEKNHLSKIKK